MKQLLIVGSRKTAGVEAMVEHIRTQVADNATIDYVDEADIVGSITNGRMQAVVTTTGKDLADYAMIYFKSTNASDITAAYARYAVAHGVGISDESKAFYADNSKLYEYSVLAASSVAVPDSLFMMLSKMKDNYSAFVSALGVPFVLKDIRASRGAFNEMIGSLDEFNHALARAEADDEPHYLIGQTFIPNDGDYRLLTLGGVVTLAIHRSRQDDSTHLNNVSQGGAAKIVPLDTLPREVIRQSEVAATALGLGVAGVDMVKDRQTGQWYCFEVNEGPQMATGSHTEAKWNALSKYLITELEKTL